MQVSVSGMAWLPVKELGAEGIAHLKKKLTIVPKKYRYGDDTEKPVPIRCWAERDGLFGLPRDFFFDTATGKHDITWELSDGLPTSYDNIITHEGDYAEQATVVDEMVAWFDGFNDWPNVDMMARGQHLGFILKADPAFGKTNTTLAAFHRIGRTALILVHKERLLVQWKKRIETFLPGAKVGIVQEKQCDFEGKDIVVAMIQSLALEGEGGKPRYPADFYTWPGILALDEGHRVGALTWSPVPPMFPAARRLMLSATPRRKDGADKVFWWHFGPIRFDAKTERPKPAVRMIESGLRSMPEIMRSSSAPPPLIINILTKMTYRNRKIVAELVKALKSPGQRKIMVLSERLEHLRTLDEMLKEACKVAGLEGITTGFYVGEWFTGEKSKKLAKGHWEMDEAGREEAINTIYLSFRRRKNLKAEKNEDTGHRMVLVTDVDGEMSWMDLDGLHGLAQGDPKRLKAADDWLFALAGEHQIKQKVVEKKRTLTEEDLEEAERARVMWMTYQMCSEGIDIPAADTIGFATPISDVEQAYGRARRICIPVAHGGKSTPDMCAHYCSWRADTCKGKPSPIAFDIVDRAIPLANRRQRYRLEFYKKVGAKVAGAVP